jgi:hypothetical protein
MTAPSKKVRGQTYLRDGFRCVSCGSRDALTWQHREASGMGGRGDRAPELTTADGLTLCYLCNQACEAEGQQRALALGWKLRRNRGGILASQIPYYDRNERAWFLPGGGSSRLPCHPMLAAEILEAVGNLRPGLVA